MLGDHSTQCKNANPSYEIPETHTKRLAFIRDLVIAGQSRDVTRSDEAMLSRCQGVRQKHFYRDRAKAINAMWQVFAEHVNVVTHQIEISLRNASDAAGLSTTSAAELAKAEADPHYTPVVSTSRASRAFKDMVDLGWIRADRSWQVWDKEAGHWTEKYFEATTLFFNAAGITSERVQRQQNARLGYIKTNAIKSGLSAEEAGRMSIAQLKEERKQRWRRSSFERRATTQARKKVKRALHEKTRAEQRQIAQKRVLDFLGDDLHTTNQAEFKELVNREIAMLRKFTSLEPPLH